MKVAALVIWYDEHPQDLYEMAVSLRGFADCMVALDGAFANFPSATATSAEDQAAALAQGCADTEIELLVYQPEAVGKWVDIEGEEVAKRNAAFKLAAALAPDWVVVIDADMRLGKHDGARDLMEWTDLNVAISNVDGGNHRHIFRWSPSLRYFRTHYTAVTATELLAGPPGKTTMTAQLPPLSRALDLYGILTFEHVEKRQEGRRARANAYYASRDERGVEHLS